MQNCLIEGGCPCPQVECPRHGKCNECIRHHYEIVKRPVMCMRDIPGAITKSDE